MSATLAVRGLTRDFGGPAPALTELTLDVPAGSCLAILGPSGSGKTTVLRLASGLDRPDRGDVLVDGVSVLDVAPEQRGMAMVFQRPLLFPHRSVLDNVAFAARVRGESRRRARADARDYLDLVHLTGLGDRHPSKLSGGQEQRVAIARALAARPRVLLLDEPFGALDAALRSEMHDLVRQVRAALGPTIVLVTHDHAEAATMADDVAVLSDGRLVQHDTVDRIYHRPASLTTARLMGGRNEVPGEVRGRHHLSVLGKVALPVDLRPQEGPGVLVFRHESVEVSDPHAPGVLAEAQVVSSRPAGARRLLALEVVGRPGGSGPAPAVHVYAETPPGQLLGERDRVGIRLSPHSLAVVPEEPARNAQVSSGP